MSLRPVDVSDQKPEPCADPGAPPMLQWVRIADLAVDPSYQRDLGKSNWRAIRRIAERFSWSKFSPVFVAPAPGGKFVLIDGQHRSHAAALCGFDQVPAQVVQMSHAEQASAFSAVNGSVTKVTGWQVYRAALTAGEAWAVACRAAVAAADCVLMSANQSAKDKKPGEVYAVALIRGHVAAGQGAEVTRALDALRRSEAGADVELWGGGPLKPWLAACAERAHLTSARADLAAFLDGFDMWDVREKAEAFLREKRRQGVTGLTRNDFIAAEIGAALDRAFPVRMRGAA